MSSLILFPLIVAIAAAAPLNQNTPASTYLANYPAVYYPMQHGYPVEYPFADAYSREGLTRQSVSGLTVIAQQMAAALSNLQLYYTVQKWNVILCLLDSTCPEVVLPPTPPFGREQSYPALVRADQLA